MSDTEVEVGRIDRSGLIWIAYIYGDSTIRQANSVPALEVILKNNVDKNFFVVRRDKSLKIVRLLSHEEAVHLAAGVYINEISVTYNGYELSPREAQIENVKPYVQKAIEEYLKVRKIEGDSA